MTSKAEIRLLSPMRKALAQSTAHLKLELSWSEDGDTALALSNNPDELHKTIDSTGAGGHSI
jgi:hypothetical protein